MSSFAEILAAPAFVAAAAATPEEAVRQLISSSFQITALPPTKRLSVYHISGVSNPKHMGGEDKDSVIYPPEFLYVLDVGFPALCGVMLNWRNSGLGDPSFPDFKQAKFRSVQTTAPKDLIFPKMAGDLLVGVKTGTQEQAVLAGLAPYASSVSLSSTDLYLVKVKAFHERQVAAQIEKDVSFVKYASLNGIMRLIDFMPGWRVSQVC